MQYLKYNQLSTGWHWIKDKRGERIVEITDTRPNEEYRDATFYGPLENPFAPVKWRGCDGL